MDKIVITTDSGCNPRNTSNMIPCMIIAEDNKEFYDSVKLNTDEIPVITTEEAFNRAFRGERLHTSAPSFPSYLAMMEK